MPHSGRRSAHTPRSLRIGVTHGKGPDGLSRGIRPAIDARDPRTAPPGRRPGTPRGPAAARQRPAPRGHETARRGARGRTYDCWVTSSDLDEPAQPDQHGTPAELLRLRASIDNIDAALIHLLAERFKCTQQVGELKAREGMPPADPAREEAQIARLRALADEAGLDPRFAEKFLNFVIAEVIHHHEAIAGS